MRTLIDIPEDDLKWLDRKAADEGRSRAAVVREAVAQFRAAAGKKGIQRYFGLWKDRADVSDGLDYQRKMRGEWDRDWDADDR
jgi:hypothetical protein